MFLRKIVSYLWKPKADSLSLDEAYSEVLQVDGDRFSEDSESVDEVVDEVGAYEIVNRIGNITEEIDGKLVIDGAHHFVNENPEILIGSKISYQLLNKYGDVKVVRVNVIENNWDVVETGKKHWHERTLVAQVTDRKGRILTLNPTNLCVDLNKISSEFIPIVGDWVEVDIKCEVDEIVVDLSGKIIEVNKISPLRAQFKSGKITQWDSQTGTGSIDRNIFFDKHSLSEGYAPNLHEKVIAQIIESSQGSCSWRAVKLIMDDDFDKKKNINQINSILNQKFLNTHPTVSINDKMSLSFTKLNELKLFVMELQAVEELQLVCVEIPNVNGQCKAHTPIDHLTLQAGQQLTLKFECKAKNIGESRELILFHFNDFKIGRWIDICVIPRASTPSNSKQSYNNKFARFHQKYTTRNARQIIPGQKLGPTPRFVNVRIADYAIPKWLTDLAADCYNTNQFKIELEKKKSCLNSGLSYLNYEDRFHTLLFIEELHHIVEMQKYDQEKVCFIKSGEFLVLEIENLAESRPSVIQGDKIFARNIHDSTMPDYEGVIHKIAKNHVYIKFSKLFHDIYDGEDYSIHLVSGRTTFRRRHLGINQAIKNLGKEWLFPIKALEKESQLEFSFDEYTDTFSVHDNDSVFRSPPKLFQKHRILEKIRQFHEDCETVSISKLEWHNTNLNYHQKEAVRNTLLGVCRPLPYIIFGPPGTGKTVTLVETALQVLRLIPHSRILLCAPSNSAADLLALRLIDSGVLRPGDLVRLVAVTAINNISPKLTPYAATANLETEGTETQPPLVTSNGLTLGYSSSVLGRHRITVCTCSSAALLYAMGYPKGHFTHIIVDEAGQTSEPNLLIPFTVMDVTNGQAILAGDPMQLGPLILSNLSLEYGLGESFLERLIGRFPYMRDMQGFPTTCGYDPRLITKLVYNYRSLPIILKLSSLMFYNDDLKPTISEKTSQEAAALERLKNILPLTKAGSLTPIIFHSVIAENFQSEDSPSWFNPSEASQVLYYLNELYRLGVSSDDIGVITPYKAQAKVLVDLLKEADFEIPKIGSVEEFQGQEYCVIILSTVRSNGKYVTNDIKHKLGFIASPRRVNVSISRAKALMIIIGNGDLLMTDRTWRSVIAYCVEHGGCIGAPLAVMT